MLMKIGTIALTASLACASSGAAALPPSGWILSSDGAQCVVMRQSPAPGIEHLAIVAQPGSSGYDLALLGPALITARSGMATLSLRNAQGENSSLVRLRSSTAAGDRHSVQMPIDEADGVPLQRANALSIARNDRTIVATSLFDAAKAMAQLDRCVDRIVASWGFDPAAYRRLSRFASLDSGSPTTDGRRRVPLTIGSPQVRADVDASGKLVACTPLGQPQASAAATCAVVQKLTFQPALDEAGRPVRSFVLPQFFSVPRAGQPATGTRR
jgi:hypothetical protein